MADSRNSPRRLQLYRQPPRPRAVSIHPDCVVALKALAEDTRVRIIGLLTDAPLDVSEITQLVGVPMYNVSKHLRILREAGLLQVEKTGRRHLYALVDGIRKRAAESRVLDLGFCSFRFEPTAQPTPTSRSNSKRKRSLSTVAPATR
jgi:DNA-binding transcriptional ArsR family regulator